MITAMQIPYRAEPVAGVIVDERNAMSFYPYVGGGPVEARSLDVQRLPLVCYVNRDYLELPDDIVNVRATQLFMMTGVGMAGDAIRGDALVVYGPGDDGYERSMPAELIEIFRSTDSLGLS